MSAAIAGIAIGVAGLGLAGASAAGAFAPPTPQQPNAGTQVSQQINAQIAATPASYASQATFNPKFAALNSTIAWQNLFGSPAASSSGYANQTGYYDAQGNYLGPASSFNASNPVPAGAVQRTAGQYFTINAPAAPGSIATAAAAQPQLLGLQTQQRSNDIANVANLGPAAYSAIANYDPQATALLTGANAQVQERLNTNGALDPFTQMQLQQNYRSAEAARGTAGGTADAAMEAYYQEATRNARQVQNIQLADTQAGANQGYFGDPFQQVLSRTSGGVQTPTMPYSTNQPSAVAATGALVNNGLTAAQMQGYSAQVGAQNAQYLSQQAGLGSVMQSLGPLNSALGNYFNSQPSAATTAGVAQSMLTPVTSATSAGSFF